MSYAPLSMLGGLGTTGCDGDFFLWFLGIEIAEIFVWLACVIVSKMWEFYNVVDYLRDVQGM